VNTVNSLGSVRVSELAKMLEVSTVTIRGDLTFLEDKGLIVRSHGSAISSLGLCPELTVQERRAKNTSIKFRIGKAAADLIKDGDAIILDSGTTTLEIAAHLTKVERVVAMTNGLDIAMELSSKPGVDILMTGGTLRKNALSFSGSQAEVGLQNYRFNKVFLGVDGFDLQAGITTHNNTEANLNRLMCEVSEQIIAVTDSTKFGKRSCNMIRAFSGIDILITDAGIPDEYRHALQDAGVEVIIV
jgi:DeoR family transcriptional regulator, aga operon transcriptional repressor